MSEIPKRGRSKRSLTQKHANDRRRAQKSKRVQTIAGLKQPGDLKSQVIVPSLPVQKNIHEDYTSSKMILCIRRGGVL